METNLMDFSMDQDENAEPNEYQPPPLVQTPQIVNSILKKSCKDNLIQLHTPVHKPGLKVQFKTPHSTVKKSTPTRFEAVRKLDEKERWIERTSVVTKQDHLDYVMYATEFFNEIINNLPIDRKEKEEITTPDSPDSATQDTTLCNEMDVSMTVDDRVSENNNHSEVDSVRSSDTKTDNHGMQDEEDMDTDDFFDAVDTQESVAKSSSHIAPSETNTALAAPQENNVSVLPSETNDDTVKQCKDSVEPLNDGVAPETILPPSPPLPAKGSYHIDFENLEDLNPFQTKSAVANSPTPIGKNKESVASENSNKYEYVSKNSDKKSACDSQESNGSQTVQSPDGNKRHSLSQLQKVSENPFLKLIDSPIVKTQDPVEKEKALDELVKSADDDILSQSFEDIDPFKPKKQILNSPVKENQSLVQCGQDSAPSNSVTEEAHTSHPQPGESDESNITLIDAKASEELSSAIAAADESFSKSMSESESLQVFKEEDPYEPHSQLNADDPFTCKEQLANSPLIKDDENPFTCKKQLANSPVVKDDENPFTCKKQLTNSPVVKDDENPFICKKQLANSLVVKDDENPFTCKKQLTNSPVVKDDENPFTCKKQLANSPLVKDDENPFTCNKQLANSPVVKDDENTFTCKKQSANSPVIKDNENPFTCEKELVNSPVVKNDENPVTCKKQLANSPVIKDDENPFACKKQLGNSPEVKNDENPLTYKKQPANSSFTETNSNPFKSSMQIPNSPPVNSAEGSTVLSSGIQPDDDPFKTNCQIPNSPLQNSSKTENKIKDPLDVLDPFKSNNKMVNSPKPCKTHNEPDPPHVRTCETTPMVTQPQNVSVVTPSKTDNVPKQEDNITVSDPFDTPKFKSVEGGIPESTIPKDKGSLPEGALFTSPSQLGLSEDDFRSNTNDYFWDPSALDMLEKFGNTQNGTESNYSRMSLFQAFDPLVDLPQNDPRRISLAARRVSIREAKRSTLGAHRVTGFKGRESNFPEESICLFGTPTRQLRMLGAHTTRNKEGTPDTKTPNTERHATVEKTPKKAFVDLLTDTPDNKDSQTAPQLQINLAQDEHTEDLLEIVQYTEADMRGLKQRLGLEFQGILLQKEKEWQQKETDLRKEIKQVNKKLEASKQEHVTVTRNLKGMVETVNEYESIINEITKREERLSSELKESKGLLQKEKDQSSEDLQNLDKAFSDLHKRFEKTKEVLQQARQNEAKWKQYGEECATRLKKSEEKAADIKQKAEEKLNELAEKMEKMKASSEAEVTKLQATLKRKDMTLDSLQKQVEQKTTENKELTELCDQLFAKFGGGV